MANLNATDRAILKTIALRLLQREIRGHGDEEPGEDDRGGRSRDRFRGLQLLGLGDEYT